MVIILQLVGWLGIFSAAFNTYIKIFGDDEAVQRYAGASGNLDPSITIFAFSLIFLALAAILSAVRADTSKKGGWCR